MGNAFLAHIREADAICQVTRVFRDPDVSHVDGAVDPPSDIETISTELILADLQTIERVLPRLEKEARINKDKAAGLAAVREAQQVLDGGRTIFAAGLDRGPLRELFLLTAKPFLYVFNCDTDELADEALKERLRAVVAPAEAIFLDAKIESELTEMEPDEAREFLVEMGIEEPGLDVLARVGFDTLGLQTFLTAGPKEARAWTIPKGATAPEAAGVIHTDFQKGFIKAEVVSYDDLVAAGSLLNARAKGKVRLEGKDYVMADGDVVEFRFDNDRRHSTAASLMQGRLHAPTLNLDANSFGAPRATGRTEKATCRRGLAIEARRHQRELADCPTLAAAGSAGVGISGHRTLGMILVDNPIRSTHLTAGSAWLHRHR